MQLTLRHPLRNLKITGPNLIQVISSESHYFSEYFEKVISEGVHKEINILEDDFSINYAPREGGIFSDLSVLENLLLFSTNQKNYNVQKEIFFQDFPEFQTLLPTPAHYLSGGQQQVLNLARVYFRQSQLILLDEPGIGLSKEWNDRFIHSLFQHVHAKSQIAILNNPEIEAHLAPQINHRWRLDKDQICPI
jgi:ABC-type branched-subunit amino acid transport system ATPase component